MTSHPDLDHLCVPDLAGGNALGVLQALHTHLRPSTYLEIGCWLGDAVGLAHCPSIIVDPDLTQLRNVFAGKPACFLFQMTSDAFFRQHDPRQFLGREVDLAYLDGMHLYEFLLRDFANVERACRRNSVIVMHDCIPTDVFMAQRQRIHDGRAPHPGWWTGDVWKCLPILRRHRPDLRIVTIDAEPTGLVAITNLDPESRLLSDRYFDIIEEFHDLTLEQYGLRRFFDELDLKPAAAFVQPVDLAGHFWL